MLKQYCTFSIWLKHTFIFKEVIVCLLQLLKTEANKKAGAPATTIKSGCLSFNVVKILMACDIFR